MARMTMVLLLAALAIGQGSSVGSVANDQEGMNANPVRRIVNLLQGMATKLNDEGDAEKQLFDQYMCYCKKQRKVSEQAIAETQGANPLAQSRIEESQEKIKQLKLDLEAANEDTAAANKALQAARGQRADANKEYLAGKAEMEGFIGVLDKSIPALQKGMGGAFLQGQAATRSMLLKALDSATTVDEAERDTVVSFVSRGGDARPTATNAIVGILSEIKGDYERTLAGIESDEAAQLKVFEELMGAKTRQTKTLAGAIEKKTAKIGQLSVSIVNIKADVTAAEAAEAANAKFASELEASCSAREAENDARIKARGEELVALHDTIKTLNDDDALDLFKKTLPSPSLLQLDSGATQRQKTLLAIVQAMPHRELAPKLELLSMELSGHNANFDKVSKMIDAMVSMLTQQQKNDEAKVEYCKMQFDNVGDKDRALSNKVSDAAHDIEEQEEILATVTQEIQDQEENIKSLDATAEEATAQRKSEHQEFVAFMSSNNAAKDLLTVAKARMNKYYNPDFAGNFAQVTDEQSQHLTASRTASFNVISLLDKLIEDLKSKTREAGFDEKSAQSAYERLVHDSSERRTTSTKAIAEKEGIKADAEQDRIAFSDDSNSHQKELKAVRQYKLTLHSECDWLQSNFDLRKQSRTDELENLRTAKSVLAGADYSFAQGKASSGKSLRGGPIKTRPVTQPHYR